MPIASNPPSNGQVLKWNGGQWVPSDDNAGSSLWSESGSNAYFTNGDVGIGTSSIDAKTEVFHNSSLSDPHLLLHENGNDYARVNFRNNNGSNYWSIASYIASNVRNDRLNFWNGTTGDVMTITGDGEVGIGVGISPKVPFHVGNDRRILFGQDTLGNGDKLMFLPDLHAFRVGSISAGASSTYWNRDSIGLYSFASGLNTRAQGYAATAMGRDTEASNSYAHATGYFTNADGLYSTAMGFNTDASGNTSTAIGYSTDAVGSYSTAMGFNTRAQSFASVAIGRYNEGYGSSGSWVASDPIFEVGIGTSNTNRENAMLIRKDGRVGIGTDFPSELLHVLGIVRIGTFENIEDGGSFILDFDANLRPASNALRNLGNSSKRWNTVFAQNGTINTSDRREKENIEDLSYGLDEIMKLKPVSYNWISFPEEGKKLGLIAQEVKEVLSEVVKDTEWVEDEETRERREVEADRMGIYYADLIPVLIKATQEQQEVIEKQSALIDALEARLKKLEEEK